MSIKLTDLNIYDIGNKIGLVGAVFGDDDRAYMVLFPDQPYEPPAEILQLSYDDWLKTVRQLDMLEVEVMRRTAHGDLAKVVLRKTQRLIEQRVSWAVFRRDGYACRYCAADDVPLTVDHLVLWEDGGPSTEENLVTACRRCNKTRGNQQYGDWLKNPFYLRKAEQLPAAVRQANEDLAKTLSEIQRRVAERATRK